MPAAARNAQDRTVRFGFAFIGVLLIAVNLRVSFVSVGPVLSNISSDLGLDRALWMSLLILARASCSAPCPCPASSGWAQPS